MTIKEPPTMDMLEAMEAPRNAGMSEGAGIRCIVCHARPYPELSLPEIVREDFTVHRGKDGEWRCSRHSKIKPAVDKLTAADRKSAALADAAGVIENALTDLFELVGRDNDDEAGALIEEAKRALETLAPSG
jgi:hypothetical protein